MDKEKLRSKKYTLRTKYKLTLEEYNSMASSQDYKCAICGNTFKNYKDMCIDHNHNTNVVREMLCVKCNTALGLFMENITSLTNAINYIKKHQI